MKYFSESEVIEMARPRQPIDLLVLKGKKNLTKTEIKERQMQENALKGPTENIKPPSYLTAAQKKEFTEIAEKLVAIDIFSELDIDSLARYLDSKYQYLQLVKDMRKIKSTDVVEQANGKKITVANEDYPKLARVKNTLFNECRVAASDLGLTITSRLKLVIPDPTPAVHTPSEFEQKFGDI